MIKLKKLMTNMLKKWYKTIVTGKGHFVIYTADEKSYALPLAFLCKSIILELLKMSEEEFGHSNQGPIRLPCDSVLMNYIVLLIQHGVAGNLETALIVVVDSSAKTIYSSSMLSCYHGLIKV